jgi:hypothetical protein
MEEERWNAKARRVVAAVDAQIPMLSSSSTGLGTSDEGQRSRVDVDLLREALYPSSAGRGELARSRDL